MIGLRIRLARGQRDEAEKPFWISFADLMTALMALFLLVMSVALLAVTKNVSEKERVEAERARDIENLLNQIELAAKRYEVALHRDRKVIDFGDKARFDKESSQLNDEQKLFLRQFVSKEILPLANTELGKKWIKIIVVDGYASPEGDYLFNLNLSLQRSQRVLCVLLEKLEKSALNMPDDEREQIRDLFVVGGSSFNRAKSSPEESRRIELRLEFYGSQEPHEEKKPKSDIGVCVI